MKGKSLSSSNLLLNLDKKKNLEKAQAWLDFAFQRIWIMIPSDFSLFSENHKKFSENRILL